MSRLIKFEFVRGGERAREQGEGRKRRESIGVREEGWEDT